MSFDIADSLCPYETSVLLKDGLGVFNLHDSSVVTAIDSVATNTLSTAASSTITKTVSLSVLVTDLSLHSDGTIAAPITEFKIRVGSPDITTPSGAPNSLIDLLLTINLKHPCRSAVFTTQVIPPIASNVNSGPDTISLTPFVHTLEPSAYDCGLQSLTIFEDAAFAYSYSEFITVST